jgi:hypothetical protein
MKGPPSLIVLGGTMCQQVLTDLDKMIGEMEKDEESEAANAG